jgi:hypothetical protein
MNFRKIIALGKLTGQGTPEREGSTGATTVGDQGQEEFADGAVVLTREIQFCGTGETATLDLDTLALADGDAYVAPVAQKISVTVAGTVTATGTALVTLTSALYDDPIEYNVPVVDDDTAATVAGKVRAYLAARITDFTVGGSTTAVTLERVVDTVYGYANDGTLSLVVTNGTATGLTLATSTGTTTGAVATGTLIPVTDVVDAEGVAIPVVNPPTLLALMFRVHAGQVKLDQDGFGIDAEAEAPGGAMIWYPAITGAATWTLESTVAGFTDVTLTLVVVPN